MRICFDIDGVIANLRAENETYSEVTPISDASITIRDLRSNGHQVILYTARHMKSTDGNVAKVIAKEGKTLLNWLAQHNIEYDELVFGKPFADLYVDDNAVRFISWEQLLANENFRAIFRPILE